MAYLNHLRHVVLSTLFLITFNTSVRCGTNTKLGVTSPDRWQVKDTFTAGSNTWQPEYYNGPLSQRKDFVTSSYEDKYSGNSPAYGTKNRLGYTPFSSGSIYTSDRRPTYGTAHPIDYGTHDYESPYEYLQHGNGYGLNYTPGSKDLTKSVLIPLAGAALLGIAAALVANPVLLHLGVSAGKRKRRDITSSAGQSLAYHAQLQRTPLP